MAMHDRHLELDKLLKKYSSKYKKDLTVTLGVSKAYYRRKNILLSFFF